MKRKCINIENWGFTYDEAGMVEFFSKTFPKYRYHKTLSGEVNVGMLIKEGDCTLNKNNEPTVVYWNTNYNELYIGPFGL